MAERRTDYRPGDPPLPKGTVVDYSGSRKHGRYVVMDHQNPADQPHNPPTPEESAEAYPDGVAYYIWPEGTPHKMGFRHESVLFVRRTSLVVVSRPETEAETS